MPGWFHGTCECCGPSCDHCCSGGVGCNDDHPLTITFDGVDATQCDPANQDIDGEYEAVFDHALLPDHRWIINGLPGGLTGYVRINTSTCDIREIKVEGGGDTYFEKVDDTVNTAEFGAKTPNELDCADPNIAADGGTARVCCEPDCYGEFETGLGVRYLKMSVFGVNGALCPCDPTSNRNHSADIDGEYLLQNGGSGDLYVLTAATSGSTWTRFVTACGGATADLDVRFDVKADSVTDKIGELTVSAPLAPVSFLHNVQTIGVYPHDPCIDHITETQYYNNCNKVDVTNAFNNSDVYAIVEAC